MSHQSEIEKTKYRNWVKGGLALKYFREGIKGFADKIVKQEHQRILSVAGHTTGLPCNQCCIKTLRPIHRCIKDQSSGRPSCPLVQTHCSCMDSKAKPCPNKICDIVLEEVLNNHASTPPQLNWRNTDIQKWVVSPWEIAKCFIQAPGYSSKTGIADVDLSGLLHIFIYNFSFHEHFSCSVTSTDRLKKALQIRNDIFHSPNMEIDDTEFNTCIDNILDILGDDKELKSLDDVKQAVSNLKELKNKGFIITTHSESEVCRASIASIIQLSDELTDNIEKITESVRANVLEDSRNDCEVLKQRVERLKTNVASMQQRLSNLERKKEEMDAIRCKQTQHLKYIQAKEELQQNLVKLYQRYYVKVSVSPLKLHDDDINVQEIYVTPQVVVDCDRLSRVEKGKDMSSHTEKRFINHYQELFCNDNCTYRRIYILGDVGAGKSSFCKMMIETWCKAVSSCSIDTSNARKEVNKSLYDTFTNDEDQMRKFDFLFFIPLRRMSYFGSDVTVEMIKELTKDLTPRKDLIDSIFEQESGRCLILADGLDEWKPPKQCFLAPHVSYGIPNGDKAKEASTIILSRPSAKGIINLKTSEFDLKLELQGISKKSIEQFVGVYLLKNRKPNVSYKDFIEASNANQIKDVEKSPLLLQQLLGLYCKGVYVDKSICDTYCQILNAMLGWTECKYEYEDLDEIKSTKKVKLPGRLAEFPRFKLRKQLLLSVGSVAFDAFTSHITCASFGRSYLLDNGLTSVDINALIEIGILVEEKSYDPTKESTELAFIHMSYVEFFAAFYVSSCCLEENAITDAGNDGESANILKKLFAKCLTVASILPLENVLKMICGLLPCAITPLTKEISEIVNNDKAISKHRHKLGYGAYHDKSLPSQLQRLVINCLSECGCENTPTVNLCDVIFDGKAGMTFLHSVIPESVISLSTNNLSNAVDCKTISKFRHVQYMYIGFSRLPHSEMSLLSSMIKELNLKCLTFWRFNCANCECTGHEIERGRIEKIELNFCRNTILT